MPERSPMTTVGDTITVKLNGVRSGTITAVVSGGASPLGAAVATELSADDGTTWELATLNKPDRTTTASLANGQSGWTEAVGYTHARLRLTAITSGTQGGRLTYREG